MQREIQQLRQLGFDITVFAAAGSARNTALEQYTRVRYRRPLFSLVTFLSLGYFLRCYRLGVVKLLILSLKLIVRCPREAKILLGNLHTIAYFSWELDQRAISHIHAYFLSWPASMGLALAVATSRSLSIAAHARDVYVERGALSVKVPQACFVTVCTREGLDYLRNRLATQFHHKLHLIHHGIPVPTRPTIYSQTSICNCTFSSILIAVGRLVPKKGFNYLMEAFALVQDQQPSCRLVIVGDGPEHDKLMTLTKKLNLNGSVEFVGWQDNDVVMQLLGSATALVVPSVIAADGDRDGMPNVILEAFANGVPVIASRLRGIAEAIRHLQSGLLVEPGDVTRLASAALFVLQNRWIGKKLAQEAYETLACDFDIEKNVRRLADLFGQIKE